MQPLPTAPGAPGVNTGSLVPCACSALPTAPGAPRVNTGSLVPCTFSALPTAPGAPGVNTGSLVPCACSALPIAPGAPGVNTGSLVPWAHSFRGGLFPGSSLVPPLQELPVLSLCSGCMHTHPCCQERVVSGSGGALRACSRRECVSRRVDLRRSVRACVLQGRGGPQVSAAPRSVFRSYTAWRGGGCVCLGLCVCPVWAWA